MTIYPIWKDIILNATAQLSSGKVDFAVYKDSQSAANLIYSGTAYADAANTCNIRLNDIFKDYLGSSLDTSWPQVQDTHAVRQFVVAYGSASATYKVLNEWTYEYAYHDDAGVEVLSGVIGKWNDRTAFPITFIGVRLWSYQFYDTAGVLQDYLLNQQPAGESTTLYFDPEYGAGRLELTLWPASGGATVTHTFYVEGESCSDALLTYRNEKGGYGLLTIASVVESEAYERNTYDTTGSNAYSYNHIRRDFTNKVTKTYTLRTPVLTDAESAKIGGVLGSPEAWLSYGGKLLAVSVKAGSWKKKTFKNEGRKRVVYEFDVEFAQPMERR